MAELTWHRVAGARRAARGPRADRRRRATESSPSPTTTASTARSTTAARTRAGRSARARSRTACCAARGTASTTARSPGARRASSPTTCRPIPSRSATTASTSASSRGAAARAHGVRRDGRDDGRVGRHACLRDGRALEPRPRRRDPPPRARPGELTYIGIRHEGAAAFAASAYGKLTGRPAACLTIAGPGATNLLTGLWDAKVDRAPVLALTGQVDVAGARPGRLPGGRPRRGVRAGRRAGARPCCPRAATPS